MLYWKRKWVMQQINWTWKESGLCKALIYILASFIHKEMNSKDFVTKWVTPVSSSPLIQAMNSGKILSLSLRGSLSAFSSSWKQRLYKHKRTDTRDTIKYPFVLYLSASKSWALITHNFHLCLLVNFSKVKRKHVLHCQSDLACSLLFVQSWESPVVS